MTLLLLIASAANASGLGKLVVLSAMGEPFRAEIDLLSYPDERSTLLARLASPDRYPPADFRYNPALAATRLNIGTRPNGRRVIEVTSVRPLNEPFVYLLVELESDGARIMRGYTALLDPPGYRAQRETAAAEYLPVVVPVAVAAARRASVPGPVAASGKVVARKTPRAEPLSYADAKTLAAVLKRVAKLEAAVAQLQRQWEKPDVVAAVQVATEVPLVRNPVAAAPVTVSAPAAATDPRRAPVRDSILNEALLVLVGGMLVLLAGVAWVMWGRSAKDRTAKGS